MNILSWIKSAVINAAKFAGIYFVWIIIHYLASHLYVKFCTPENIFGFIMSPLLTISPHCIALRWAVNNGAIIINSMWVILATWISAKLIFPDRLAN